MPLLADVRSEERRGAVAAFLTLFGILASHTVLETARDALFLARLPATQLPAVYFAMAALAVAIPKTTTAVMERIAGPRGLSLLLLGLSAVTFLFWAAGGWHLPWMLRALYVWTGLVATLATLRFWIVLGETYTITQAKRLYRVIGTGSLLGAVAGAALARVVSGLLPASHLILAASVLMAATALGPALLLKRAPSGSLEGGGVHSIAEIRSVLRRQPYVIRLAGLTLVSAVAVTLADYVFKSAVAASVPKEQLGSFFSSVYMALNALALLSQVFVMGVLLRVFGLHPALHILPALLMLGAGGVAGGGGLVAALLLKGADGALRNSVHRTGMELLALPIPDALRSKVKPVIDIVGQRGGQALASVFILSELSMRHGDALLATTLALLCVLWIAWIADLRPHYVEMFRAALREGRIETTAELPELDLGSLEALVAALNSPEDEEVVAALDLLAEEGRGRLIPALVLYHPSDAVVLRALALLEKTGRTDFVPIADRLLVHPSHDVRAAALRARTTVRPEEGVLKDAVSDASPLVRATAVVSLLARGWVGDEAQQAFDALAAEGSHETRRALANAIERNPAPVFEPFLGKLALGPEADVQAAAARAMGALRNERLLPRLLPLLSHHGVRLAARNAFLAFGAEGLRFLDESLGDASLPQHVRRHLPRTISRFSAREAVSVLQLHLLRENDGMVRFRILRGLGRLAADNPDVPLDRGVLSRAVEQTIEAAARMARWRTALARGARETPARATRGHDLLAQLVRDKQAHALERLFRLLGLLHREEDFARIHRGLRSSNPKTAASSRELLENVLEPPLRGMVLELVEERPDSDGDGGSNAGQAAHVEYGELLMTLLQQASETLRCLAAHHLGELKLRDLRSRIEAQRAQETGVFAGRVMARTLRLLLPAPEGESVHAG